MDSLRIAAIVLGCTLLGGGVGCFLRRFLPESHLSGESKDVIKQGFGLIATMVALVLGLLVASAKSAFDAQNTGFGQLSTNIIVLDRALDQYGPEAKPVREKLRRAVTSMIDHLWPAQGSGPALAVDSREITADGASLFRSIRELSPKDDSQRSIQSQAIQVGADLAKTRWTLSQPAVPLLPDPFLVVLAFWLTVLFASFGLLTPRNGTVVVTLFVCALSMAGAMFLIIDLGEPLGGLIQISDASLRYALTQIGR